MFKTIKARISLLVGIPLLLTVIFSIDSLIEKTVMMREMSRIEAISDLSVNISAFVHEMQKERGITAGFVGSDRTKLASELSSQRKQTNTKNEQLEANLEDFDKSNYSKTFNQILDTAIVIKNRLDKHRQNVDQRKISDQEAIGYYTSHNAAMIATIQVAAKIVTNVEMAAQMIAYVNLMQGKERAGIERAIMNKTFTADRFEKGILNKFSALVSAQTAFFNVFESTATPDQLDYFQNKMSAPVIAEVQKMRDTAFEVGSVKIGGFGIDPALWFKKATAKINLMKEVEDKLAGDIVQMASSLKTKAILLFAVFTGIILIVFAGIAMAMFMIRKITEPLLLLGKAASKYKEGDLSYELNYLEKNEIGVVVEAFREMAQEQQKKADLAQSISQGDLTHRVKKASENDTLGDALQQMTQNLNQVMEKITAASSQVKSGSDQISQAGLALSQATTEHAASVEEISSTMTEIEHQTKTSAQNASLANQHSATTLKIAEEGNDHMNMLVSAMDEINLSSNEISKIIKLIDEIAFQTNLLALNAAVEAARAGAHGKGFAVVAEEVRNLAGRCSNAAKDTSNLITKSLSLVENGKNLADQTASSLSEIVSSVSKVNELVEEIATASTEQANGITQINQGLSQIDVVTQQNSASAEETASTSEQLMAEANALQNLLGRFKLRREPIPITVSVDEIPVTPVRQLSGSQLEISSGFSDY